MTDPNVIEAAVRQLAKAVKMLSSSDNIDSNGDCSVAGTLADEADRLLAAAEKPAEKPPAPVVPPALPWVVRALLAEIHDSLLETADTIEPPSGTEYRDRIRAILDPHAAVHSVDAVPTEVHERGWQWRPTATDTSFAPPFGTIRACTGCGCLTVGGPSRCGRCVEVAPAAPAIVPVKFATSNSGPLLRDARGDGWSASHDMVRLYLSIDLRPGEDAGVTTARILAAVGRSA